MSELEPVTLRTDFTAAPTVHYDDLYLHTPLESNAADEVCDAISKSDDIADDVLEILESVQRISDNASEVSGGLSQTDLTELNNALDALCDQRDSVSRYHETIAQYSDYLTMMIQDDDANHGSGVTLDETGQDAWQAVVQAESFADELYDVIDQNIQSIANYIDQ